MGDAVTSLPSTPSRAGRVPLSCPNCLHIGSQLHCPSSHESAVLLPALLPCRPVAHTNPRGFFIEYRRPRLEGFEFETSLGSIVRPCQNGKNCLPNFHLPENASGSHSSSPLFGVPPHSFYLRTEEVVQQLRSLATFAENLRSVPITYMVGHHCL